MSRHEELIKELEATGLFKVLRKIQVRPTYGEGVAAGTCLVLDVETTGTDAIKDEITQCAFTPITYSADGTILSVGPTFSCYNEVSYIAPEVTELTGITVETVRGHKLDAATIGAAIASATYVVAHKADFDRKVLERYVPEAKAAQWLCSVSMIPWKALGFGSAKLEFIASQCGYHYEAHRAESDTESLTHLLGMPLADGVPPLRHLLAAASVPLVRVYAVGSAFASKDTLKARGYRWPGASGPLPNTWYIDVPATALAAETEWLKPYIRGAASTRTISLTDRFSIRE